MWNALCPDIKLTRNINAFKKMLKASLLENYKFLNSEQFFDTEMYVEYVFHNNIMIYLMLL